MLSPGRARRTRRNMVASTPNARVGIVNLCVSRILRQHHASSLQRASKPCTIPNRTPRNPSISLLTMLSAQQTIPNTPPKPKPKQTSSKPPIRKHAREPRRKARSLPDGTTTTGQQHMVSRCPHYCVNAYHNSLTSHTGYPVFIPAYSPFIYMPYSPTYYPTTPGCMSFSHGAGGTCAAGTCSGAVSAGSCGAGHCGGGMTGGKSDFELPVH